MKLVRKNEEFIVIENNGSYHKVALTEIDELIVLLCEAKRVDPAKANKSIGENLFEDQERTLKVFTPYLRSLDRDYDRVKRVMGMSVSEVWNKLKDDVQAIKEQSPLEFGNKHFDIPAVDLLPYLPRRLTNEFSQTDCFIGVDPSLKTNLTMNILKGRQQQGKDMKFTVDLERLGESLDVNELLTPEEAGLDLTLSVKKGLKYVAGKQKRKKMLEIKNSPYVYGLPIGSNKQDVPRPEEQELFNNEIRYRFGLGLRLPRQGCLDKADLSLFTDPRIPSWYRNLRGSPLRNPLSGGRRNRHSQWPIPAVVYWPVLAAFKERMAFIAETQYVATAFPKRFDRNNVTLPVRYTKDVAYFVLDEGCEYNVATINDIRNNAVKAWEC